jgi:acetolactate synthase-1/2/3 large subunit
MREQWGAGTLFATDGHRRLGEYISTYYFAEVLGGLLEDDDVLCSGASGLATEIFLLSVPLWPGREVICNWSLGAMGYGIPTAIGACVGSGRRRTICVDGDGGFQVNVQELATIGGLGLPIKMFVFNNVGYASMRASQQRWFGHTYGTDRTNGLHLPDLEAVTTGYGLPFARLDGWQDLRRQVMAVLDSHGPIICEIPSPPFETRPPHQTSGSGWSPTTKFRGEQ